MKWNVLYSLGYMYTDVKKSIDIINNEEGDYKTFGEYIGDFFIRFFYSRYKPRS